MKLLCTVWRLHSRSSRQLAASCPRDVLRMPRKSSRPTNWSIASRSSLGAVTACTGRGRGSCRAPGSGRGWRLSGTSARNCDWDMTARCLTDSHCGRLMTSCVLDLQCSHSSLPTCRRVSCRYARRVRLNVRLSVSHRQTSRTSTTSTGSGCRTASLLSRTHPLTTHSHSIISKSPSPQSALFQFLHFTHWQSSVCNSAFKPGFYTRVDGPS